MDIINKTKPETINKSPALMEAKIEKLLENGRKEIKTKEELEKFPIGSIFSYINKNGIFKNGGFIIKFLDDYFIYITIDFMTKYRVRYNNIEKMWVGDPRKIKNDVISLMPAIQKPTNFEVKLGKTVVYYAPRDRDKKRFTKTNKYKIMEKWYKTFVEAKKKSPKKIKG
ncbi:MAG: hypothetical protein Satyrvirus24_6 [Satyrvirus sp.]|uniref:Uncharacterized protein n=1 Tax=Satyrvirus sp. TaxID=2487771 RepID=A0A3G5AEG9_9VIRU|nr:MAG: hypothetical protein Satyrvirus24_6 [Satyrvirus sp.]